MIGRASGTSTGRTRRARIVGAMDSACTSRRRSELLNSPLLDPAPPWATMAEAPARLRAVDFSVALAVPGVVAALGAPASRALPSMGGPSPALGRPTLATDTVRFVGEPIAVVVARDRYAAADGAAAVRVDSEP